MATREVIIKDTHRGLRYEDGVLKEVLGAGRYELPPLNQGARWWETRKPQVEIVLVDMRERDLTIKGQEILTSDKVAIRVSILVQFRVVDPRAALHTVASYEDRLYSDVQLAARRSLAAMTLEEILTNRTRLSEEILREVKESAAGYGVAILRADVKDLIFPGNLQEVMNKVLAAERLSEVQLIDARTKAEVQRIEAQTRAEAQRLDAQTKTDGQRLLAEAEAQAARTRRQMELEALQERQKLAANLKEAPDFLRLEELEALRELARTATARIYIGFDRQPPVTAE